MVREPHHEREGASCGGRWYASGKGALLAAPLHVAEEGGAALDVQAGEGSGLAAAAGLNRFELVEELAVESGDR
jgi:hypothetical protein